MSHPGHGSGGDQPPRVTRVEVFGPRGLRVRVHLDRGEGLEVALEALERSGLGLGDPLGTERRASLLGLDAEVRVRDSALHLLAHRARTASELRSRLRRKGFEADRIEACLARLAQRGLIDDAAVAAALVRDRLRHRPRGSRRLTSELRAKGVAPGLASEVIDEVFDEEGVDDRHLAVEVAEAWVARQGAGLLAALADGARTPDRDRAHRRLVAYLGRRGFGGDALRSGVDHALARARESR